MSVRPESTVTVPGTVTVFCLRVAACRSFACCSYSASASTAIAAFWVAGQPDDRSRPGAVSAMSNSIDQLLINS